MDAQNTQLLHQLAPDPRKASPSLNLLLNIHPHLSTTRAPNMNNPQVWNGQDPTLSAPDDFQQFLEMNLAENLQFDFQDFPSQQDAQMMQQGHGEGLDTQMSNIPQVMAHDTSMHEVMAPITTTAGYATKPALVHPTANDSLVELDAQIQYLQHQRHQQQQRQLQEQQRNFYAQQRMIPPTPNSVELHSATSQYYRQPDGQQNMFERYQMQGKEQDMAFTPLVSPAVTPLETHFNIPEYTVPGAYFSPLSSPALHAQTEHSSVYNQHLSNATNSPIDMNDSQSAPTSSVILSKKVSRKAASKPRAARSVRQSPIVKPKRNKRHSITSLPTQVLGDILEPSAMAVEQPGVASSAASTAESESDSISPEHLSEMAPPPLPLPGSANRSPYVQAHKDPVQKRLALGSPATPASLMKMTQSPINGASQESQNMDIDEAMDAFALPEPATTQPTRPPMSRIETTSDGQTTPTLNSVSKSFSMASPKLTRPKNATSDSQSPQIDAMSTNGRKTPLVVARGPKKRGSTSVLASPALLPRISPSIKPLLAVGGKVSDDTASLLLASKSNYQNILEGTHLPGVSYPTELSTNLTSKRTSHKIAEQGRRNRINSALQEIATLLPKPGSKDSGCEKSGDADEDVKTEKSKISSQSANSKASTVEQAIEYIKQLQQEVAEANKRAEKAEKELESVKTS